MIHQRIAQGFTAVKMNATEEMHFLDNASKIAATVGRMKIIRNEFGNDLAVALDFHGLSTSDSPVVHHPPEGAERTTGLEKIPVV